jgi:D-glycero-alpha-D-manno-heptose 1-phosphate guanylyltransferase
MLSEVVILCGGRGTRLRSVIQDVPKPMAPVGGRPFLEIILSQYAKLGFRRAVLSTGYMAPLISGHFGERFEGLELRYSIDPEPLGTGGAARAGALACEGGAILVCNGDTYLEFDFFAARALHSLTGSPVAVALQVPDTERYGRIEIDGESKAHFVGAGVAGEGFISGGIYFLPRALLLNEPRPAPFSLESFVFDPTRSGMVRAHVAQGRFIDIGIPEDYERAKSMFGGG